MWKAFEICESVQENPAWLWPLKFTVCKQKEAGKVIE